MTENVPEDTAWNIPKYGLFLVCVFAYLDRTVSVFSGIWTESEILYKYEKIRIRFCPHTGKYGNGSIQTQKIKKQPGRIIKVCVNLEINFWYKHTFSGYVIILVLQWKVMCAILDEDFQKSGALFNLTKTSRSSNSSRVSFLWIFSHAVSLAMSTKVCRIFFVYFCS